VAEIEIEGVPPQPAHEMAGPLSTYLDGIATGTLDKHGFFEFIAPMSVVNIDILSGKQEMSFADSDDNVTAKPYGGTRRAQITVNNFQVVTDFTGEVGTHAVDIGTMGTYAYLHESGDGTGQTSHGHWLMLVKRLEGNANVEKWHKTGMACIEASSGIPFLRGWDRKKAQVGGVYI
jgi:hypothetical protein